MVGHVKRFLAAIGESCSALDVNASDFRRDRELREFELDVPPDSDPATIAERAIDLLWEGTDGPYDLVVLLAVVTFLSRTTGRFATIAERADMLDELSDLLGTPGLDVRDVRDWLVRNYFC